MDTYNTGINNQSVLAALWKAEEVKEMASANVANMAQNVESTEDLLDKSQNISALGKDLYKNAETLETMQRR